MKKLMLIGLVALGGCDDYIEGKDVERAVELCKDHRGIQYVVANGLNTAGQPRFICKDHTAIQELAK